MSDLGQTRRFRDVRGMSGLPPPADISGHGRHFAFVPEAVISQATIQWERSRSHRLYRKSGCIIPCP
jgi:hypothetical protein